MSRSRHRLRYGQVSYQEQASCHKQPPAASKYLYLKSDTENGIIQLKKAGLEVRLELSGKSLVDNKLVVINRSKKRVSLLSSDIHFEIMGTDLRATAVPNFFLFIEARLARLDSLCGKASNPETCSSELKEYYRSLKPGGFPYGSISPRDTMSGYVALDIPLVISRSKWDKSEITRYGSEAITYMANVTISFRKENKKVVFTMPVMATVFNKLDTLPYGVAKYLR